MDFEIAVVGAGPAGSATALFLLHAAPELAGRVVLLERARFPREKVCAGAIGARADRALASIGVRIDVPSVRVRGLALDTPGGALLERLEGHGAIGRVVRRREYDTALVHAAVERGAVLHEGTVVRKVEPLASGVRLHTSQGALSASVVVGADGVQSVIRRALGLGRGPLYAQAVEVDTPADELDGPSDVLRFELRDDLPFGYAWHFPTVVAGRRLVCRGVYRVVRGAGSGASTRPDVGELLARVLRERGHIASGLRPRRFAERGLTTSEPASGDRLLLAGEAAGIDPVLGEGIAQAVLYGRVAGQYLAGCAREGRYELGDYRQVVLRSRVGLDLRIRGRMLPWIYGPTRPIVERFLTSSPAMVQAGMHYFAGLHVPRRLLARAAADLLIAARSRPPGARRSNAP